MYNARNYIQELFFSIRRFIGIFKIQGILKDYYPPMYNLPGILGYLLNAFLQTHYQKQLQNIFQEKTKTLTNLLTYRLCQTRAMTHANIWHQGNYTKILYKNTNLTSQRISEFPILRRF
jgi:DNA-binding transcriptional regulator YbjK